MNGKSQVSLVKVRDYTAKEIGRGLEKLLGNLGGIEKLIPRGTRKVLVKPNFVGGFRWNTGITVNLDLPAALVKMLRNSGIKFVVGEGAGWGMRSEDAFEKCGAKKLFEKLGIPLLDFKRGEFEKEREIEIKVPKPLATKTVTVDRIVSECDFIISLAKLKTHCEAIVSLSLKNMKGLITRDKQRLAFHLLNVNKCLIDINSVFKPDLAIIEGLIGLQGIGPLTPGKPIDLGILVASSDPVAADSVCCRIMGIEPESVTHIRLAAQQGMGKIKSDDIEIIGEKLEDVMPEHYELPPTRIEDISPFENIEVIAGNPCSNCIAGLASYLHGYIRKELVEKATCKVKILIGPRAKPEFTGNEIALGNCLRRYKGRIPFCPGCPPPSDAYLKLVENGLTGKFEVE